MADRFFFIPNEMQVKTQIYRFNADLYTAVGLYMGLRNHHRKPCLLESNDYHSRADSASFIGIDPLLELIVLEDEIQFIKGTETEHIPITNPLEVTKQLEHIIAEIQFGKNSSPHNGFFSYFSFEYAHLEETTVQRRTSDLQLPKAHLILYQYIIVFDHFHDTGEIIYNSFSDIKKSASDFEELLRKQSFTFLPFELHGEESSKVSDPQFLSLVGKAKQHISRGDVFQLVVSRPYQQQFFGDDFQVYRQLRRLNPSPYLFYVDMESYRLMGSSPETQLQVKKGKASIHPIAGTVRKTGEEQLDLQVTQQLINDEKENAEHTMLVDLARNDLSKYCKSVQIESYKDIQHFSHVIHLVSKVTGQLMEDNTLPLFSGTFPAGTLSGTPKPKALELIQNYENDTRDYYGGAIGFLGTDGSMNLAIVIRSILSKNNLLHYRAGAGVVYDSIPENELQEVHNKLGAVRKAIQAADSTVYAL